jgi:2-aminoadipate transaminase
LLTYRKQANERRTIVAVVQGVGRWADLFAARTRQEESDALAAILALANARDVISFSGGFPDPLTFPGEELADLMRELLLAKDASLLQYGPTRGLPGLRDYLAGRLETLEGRRPAEDELLVTSGGVEALELLGKAFLDPGDLTAVEAPTYLGAIMAFQSFESRVSGIPMDGEGLMVDAAASALERPSAGASRRAKLLYTIPDHQNPAGVSLCAERRHSLVDLARRQGVLLVEDVAYRELGFAGSERLPSLWSLAPDACVQVGTFSKTFFPGVRLGWAVGPAEVVAQMTRAKQNTDQCSGALGQRLLEEWGRRGMLDAGVAASRALYQHRWEVLAAGLDEHMPDSVSWTRPHGGFFTWLTLPGGADASVLAERALRKHGVAFVPGEPFFPDGRGQANLRLSFSRIEDDESAEGARRLGTLFRETAS